MNPATRLFWMAEADPRILRAHQAYRHRAKHARPSWWRRHIHRLSAAVTAPLWPAWALYQVAHPLCARPGDRAPAAPACRPAPRSA